MGSSDGMTYAPVGAPAPVVAQGEFVVAAVHLDHGHIHGMCRGLREAGATIGPVYDPDPAKVAAFLEAFPGARPVDDLERVLGEPGVHLVAAAAVPAERGPLGVRVMRAGKDYFTDKAPFTSLAQLADAREAVAATGRKYMVYYSERLHVESAVHAGALIADGVIGKVLHVLGTGPHRLNATARPEWFFSKERYGGILCDIGSHQVEQFLHFAGVEDARVSHARVANLAHPHYPELEDFGEAALEADDGSGAYFRVDWLTPDGLSVWGDGRTFIVGDKGTMELRKYTDVGRSSEADQLFLVTAEGETRLSLRGKVGFPFFGALILDCLERTERAMTQAHAFKAAELSLVAQELADRSWRGRTDRPA